VTDVAVLPAPLLAHWRTWTGASAAELDVLGSGARDQLVVVGSAAREEPGWDGAVHGVVGIADAAGNAVVSVPPAYAEWAQAFVADGGTLDELRAALPGQMGLPRHLVFRGVCRWAVDVPSADALPDAGEWLPATDPRVPAWLKPFGGEVLVVLDDDVYVAGVGLKRHDEHGQEISVGTEEAARGRGLARRLVAQAARSLLARGIVPTYLHDPANAASGKVADAAGFPDRGWTVLGLFGPLGPDD
jgi:ribosomal protein S18 acetylase RimI-like enzyme